VSVVPYGRGPRDGSRLSQCGAGTGAAAGVRVCPRIPPDQAGVAATGADSGAFRRDPL
jgi:hypothetical protein